jgi:hypothetical protein
MAPSTRQEYRFKITAYTPTTIPMERLAEYMLELAILLGRTEHVHFVRLNKGSTVLVHKIDPEAIPEIEDRVAGAREGEGPSDAIRAVRNINQKLREDNGSGVLARGPRGATIIKFPGKEEKDLDFGVISEEGSLDGIVNRVGGDSDPCPIHLKSSDGTETYLCDVDKALAKELAKYLFDTEIRVRGIGRWIRDEKGVWSLERFRIKSFELLDDLPLPSVIANLRTVPGGEWSSLDDPWAELDRIRNGSEADDDGLGK